MLNIIENLKIELMEEEPHDKTSFWASDCLKDTFELYHRFMGTPVSNPIEPEKKIIFTVGKMVELAIVEKLAKVMDIVATDKDKQTEIDMVREGIKITGKIDCIGMDLKGEVILEIKSYYGDVQEAELSSGKPKMNYLMQLAMYMDARDTGRGMLLYFNRGTGQMYQFPLYRKEGLIFECVTYKPEDTAGKYPNKFSFDLSDEYKRFAKIYQEYIQPKMEPDSDYTYKIPIDQIDWTSLSAAKISSARTGKAVIGDWQAKYSPYKDLLVSREAAKYGKRFDEYIGYDTVELDKICELTKNYTTWKKKK